MKFKESTQWYSKVFYVATAMETAVYSKNMTKNIDYSVLTCMNGVL